MLIHDDVPTARGFDGVKVSASEHRAVTNGRDERRIEKRFRRGVSHITSEGWFLTPKMSSKGPLFVKKKPRGCPWSGSRKKQDVSFVVTKLW